MRACVVVFPGSNCDRDAAWALEEALGAEVTMLRHDETELPDGTDLVVLPGGFSYGDYLRSGAMAARAPLIPAIRAHAGSGGLLLGICNGFQVLTETRLLPGALLRNSGLNFLCRHVCLRVERTDTPFTGRFRKGQVVRFPIAHHEGLYWLPEAELDALERAGRVVFRYASSDGQAGPEAAPNGSLRGIAGILNERGNVLGLMPHPERVCHDLLGGTDGIGFFRSIGDWLEGRAPRGAEGGDIR